VKTAVCIDTGIITQYYSENPPNEILNLMNKIKNKELKGHILYPILVELYYHICKLLGKGPAEVRVASFLNNIPFKLVSLNKTLVFKAGELKCSHSKILSYNDSLIVAYALNKKITLHTTEKNLHQTFPDLKVKEYVF